MQHFALITIVLLTLAAFITFAPTMCLRPVPFDNTALIRIYE